MIPCTTPRVHQTRNFLGIFVKYSHAPFSIPRVKAKMTDTTFCAFIFSPFYMSLSKMINRRFLLIIYKSGNTHFITGIISYSECVSSSEVYPDCPINASIAPLNRIKYPIGVYQAKVYARRCWRIRSCNLNSFSATADCVSPFSLRKATSFSFNSMFFIPILFQQAL